MPDMLTSHDHARTLAARAALAASLSEAYFTEGGTRSDRERELMAEVLQYLIRDVDLSMRGLVQRAASFRAGPASAMARVLGSDEVDEIADLLRESDALTDDDLVALIRRRDDEYRKIIAERKSINPRVADALIAHSGEQVIFRLVANKRAQLSSDAVELLLTRSDGQPALQSLLAERDDVSADQKKRLAAQPVGRPRLPAPSRPASGIATAADTALKTLPKWLLRQAEQKQHGSAA